MSLIVKRKLPLFKNGIALLLAFAMVFSLAPLTVSAFWTDGPLPEVEDYDPGYDGYGGYDGFDGFDPWDGGYVGIVPAFLPIPTNPTAHGQWGVASWDTIFHGDPNDFTYEVGQTVNHAFVIRGIDGHPTGTGQNQIRAFTRAMVDARRNQDVTHWFTLPDGGGNIGTLGLTATIVDVSMIPVSFSGANRTQVDFGVTITGTLTRTNNSSIELRMPTNQFGPHGALTRTNFIGSYVVLPGITVNNGENIAVSGRVGETLPSEPFTVTLTGGGFPAFVANYDVTEWLSVTPGSTTTWEDIGIELRTVGTTPAGASSVSLQFVGTSTTTPMGAPLVSLDEVAFGLNIPAQGFEEDPLEWDPLFILFSTQTATIEVLAARTPAPFISGLTGETVTNGQQVLFETEQEITGVGNDVYTITVDLDNFTLLNGLFQGVNASGWELVGTAVDAEGEPVGEPIAIFETGYQLRPVTMLPPGSSEVTLSIVGTVIDTVRNWTDLMVKAPNNVLAIGGVSAGTGYTNIIGELLPGYATIAANAPSTEMSYAISDDGEAPVIGATSSNVIISGSVGANIAFEFNYPFTVGLGHNHVFHTAQSGNVSNWFTNMPAGLVATIVTGSGGQVGDSQVDVEFTGSPTAPSDAVITVSVPAIAVRNLVTGQQATTNFPATDGNTTNRWNIVDGGPRTATVSDIIVGGLVGHGLDQQGATMTVTLSNAQFGFIFGGTVVGGITNTMGHSTAPEGPNDDMLFYIRSVDVITGVATYTRLDLDTIGITARVVNTVMPGSDSVTIEFLMVPNDTRPYSLQYGGLLRAVLDQEIIVGFQARHIQGGGQLPVISNGVVLYSTPNPNARFAIENSGVTGFIHAFAGNSITGSVNADNDGPGNFIRLTLPAGQTFAANVGAGNNINSWFGNSLPEVDGILNANVRRVLDARSTIEVEFLGTSAGTEPFNTLMTVQVPAVHVVGATAPVNIRNSASFVSVAGATVNDVTVTGSASTAMPTGDAAQRITVVLHGLRPAADITVDDTWFRNPDAERTAFFETGHGLTFTAAGGTVNLNAGMPASTPANWVHTMVITVAGTPTEVMSGPFVLEIPAAAFQTYEPADNGNTISTFPGVNPTAITVHVEPNANAVFNIGIGAFVGNVDLNVATAPGDLGGAGRVREVTVRTGTVIVAGSVATVEDIWLIARIGDSGLVNMVRVAAGNTTVTHYLTAFAGASVLLELVRVITTDDMPNLVNPNFEVLPGSAPNTFMRQTVQF
jgi:hypothetical protein